MAAAFGRGMPGWPGRPAPGRPWVMPNGLLPPARGGRAPVPGAPGRGAIGASGRTPPAGPGLGAAGRGPVPRSCAARTAASCSALSCAARNSAAATSMSWALVGFVTGEGAAVFLAGAVLRGGVGLTALAALPSPPAGAGAGATGAEDSNDARNRLATGASTVLEADFTYSPISVSLASTTLLSTPSSFASSCTRGLPATALLIPRSTGSPYRPQLGT
jgi:hypothetical protein